jgi:Cu/Ag efflux pump CusA
MTPLTPLTLLIILPTFSACKTTDDYVKIAKTLDKCAKELGVNFLGGYSAIVSKGMSKSDELLIRSIPQALAQTDFVCSSINVGSTKTGINMDAVRLMGEIVKDTAENTKEKGSLGCAKLVVLCNAPDDNPFMAGAFHGVSEADAVVSVGVSGPGVVKYALESVRGEFIPSLDEGDFAVEMSMAQGTSLSQMVETCTKAEKLLKSEYPEVKQVVSRIGSAEIPTDPMPVERADIMVALKPKAEWTSATTTSDLMEKMEATLKNIPGMEAEFSQPIQMRNNELLTGIKQDVAIKIFGDDLNTLIQQAENVGKMISNVRGVSGVMVEQVAGLPQIQVRCNHERMAEYGVSVDDVNQVLETAFAGGTAGVVFEGERKFDIVLRLDKDVRTIEALQTLAIPVSAGQQEGSAAVTVPLNQLADIVYETAPAQVSHEDGARRIYVGFNVKGRDVQSTVNEIQHLLDSKLQLPDGYYYTYGG